MKNFLFVLLLSTATIVHAVLSDEEGSSSLTRPSSPRAMHIKQLSFEELRQEMLQVKTCEDVLKFTPKSIVSASIAILENKPTQAQITDCFLKGMLAFSLHYDLTGYYIDLPQKSKFFDSLQHVTTQSGQQKFTTLKATGLNRATKKQLRAFAEKNAWHETLFKELITTHKFGDILKRVNIVIRVGFRIPPQANGGLLALDSQFSIDPSKRKFLDFALRFASQPAINWLYAQADAYEKLNDQASFKKCYQLGAEAGYYKFQHRFGGILDEEGDTEDAKFWFSEAAKEEQTYPINSLAIIALREGNVGEAKKLYKQAWENGLSEAAYHLGMLLEQEYLTAGTLEANSEEVLKYYRAASKAGIVDATYNEAGLLSRIGQASMAFQLYKTAAQKGYAKAMNNLAAIYDEQGNYKEAESWFKKAAEHGESLGLINLVSTVYNRGNIDKALALITPLVKTQDPHILNIYSVLLAEKGRIEEAIKILSPIADQNNIDGVYILGLLLKKFGQSELAIRYIRVASLVNLDAKYTLATLLEESHQQESLETYQDYLDNSGPLSFQNVLKKAIAAEKTENTRQAEKYFKKAVSYNIENALLYYTVFLQKHYPERYAAHEEECLAEEEEETNESDPISSSEVKMKEKEIENLDRKAPSITLDAHTLNAKMKVEEPKTTYAPPPLSKRIQKMYARAEKNRREELDSATNPLKKPKSAPATYEDVKVVAAPGLEADIRGHELRIQMLISALANGERRGHFEQLINTDGLCSMRITQGHRLVFRITKGDMENGVRGIKILSAKGHYTDTNFQDAEIPVIWSEDDASSSPGIVD